MFQKVFLLKEASLKIKLRLNFVQVKSSGCRNKFHFLQKSCVNFLQNRQYSNLDRVYAFVIICTLYNPLKDLTLILL